MKIIVNTGRGQATGKTITFSKRFSPGSKSYTVMFPEDLCFKYQSDRVPHVETPIHGLEEKTFELGDRLYMLIPWKDKEWVGYEVKGLPDAHLTVYDGPRGGSSGF